MKQIVCREEQAAREHSSDFVSEQIVGQTKTQSYNFITTSEIFLLLICFVLKCALEKKTNSKSQKRELYS